MSNWSEPIIAGTGQGEGSGANNWQEDGVRSAKNQQEEDGSSKKDDDISVLLEDSDDEWIPGMLKN